MQHRDHYVSFRVELAEQAEQLAKTESRTISELFREVFRTYRAHAVRKRLGAGNACAALLTAYTEADVEWLVNETRAGGSSAASQTTVIVVVFNSGVWVSVMEFGGTPLEAASELSFNIGPQCPTRLRERCTGPDTVERLDGPRFCRLPVVGFH